MKDSSGVSLSLHFLDFIVIAIYLIAITWYGVRKGKRKSSRDYFLAGQSMTWSVIGVSLIAANISSTTLLGLAGDAYSTGISVFNYEWMAALILIFFGLFFLPHYLKTGIFTVPEFLERRFDARSRYIFSGLTILGNIFIETAAGLYAGILIFKIIFPDLPIWGLLLILAITTAIYTIPGGLSAVIYTEVIQAVLLLVGSSIITIVAFYKIGSWAEVRAATPDSMLSLIRPINDSSVPWTGLLTGVPLLGFYFWANNQFMVQRTLSAKNLEEGRLGALFAGFLKLPILFIMVIPGTMARVLYPDLERADLVFPTMVFDLLPIGLTGLILAGFIAAMSSSISATLNSASTLITMDFVRKFSLNTSEKNLVRYGQISTAMLFLIGALFTPLIEKFDSLFKYLQTVISFISPPIISAVVIGLFWKRANAQGSFFALLVGLILGTLVIYGKVTDTLPWLANMHFLHFTPFSVLLCSATLIITSLVTEPSPGENKEEILWKKETFKKDVQDIMKRPFHRNFIKLSVSLIVLTAILVFTFR